ncbi:AfsR/SARP family transcriptional regulator [Arthrobacter crystallopoietes]|uniref:AfsR/SARP family transcriptional regulator n=1 Tax=Crystallibacter crystallopoietes TaxID=37928 RepID=UPI001F11853B|nr:BTAD domain-containing putative transcriptional regulator [Arthrobacter crystallopoietes]
MVNSVLAAGIGHSEAAGLLAEATADIPLVLVLDGLENIAGSEEALSLIGALVRYAPVSTKIILLSRIDILFDLASGVGMDQVAAVGEAQLAFTAGEAAEALSQAGMVDVDPARAVEATGGWVTGVLFEAWRSREHVAGTGGEADPLHGYLSSQILARLETEEQDFLIITSLLDEVTPARAAALGVAGAGGKMAALRTKHVPVSWTSENGMRCHPRFREYLLALLERRDREEVKILWKACGELLHSEGHAEESVEQFLAAGALDRALDAAEAVIGKVIERLDFSVAERWLQMLAPPGSPGVLRLATAELMLAIANEDYLRACSIADRLHAAGGRDELAQNSPTGASIMAWCYWHLGRVEEMRSVIGVVQGNPETDAARYLMSLVSHRDPGHIEAPPLTGGPLDAMVKRIHYAHGRFREADPTEASQWTSAVSASWKIGTLRATGHLAEALNLYRTAGSEGRSKAWLYGIVGPELMIDLKNAEEARRVLEIGRGLIKASGSLVFQWLSWLIEAKLELRVNRNPVAAAVVLDRLEAAGGRSYAFIAEGLDTWRGLALLMSGREDDHVAKVLRRAMESMLEGNRIIDLPAVGVYLAEAEWRRGNATEADAAADQALAAANQHGSNHQLLLALADFQAVIARRLDAESGTDSPWHEIARALMAQGIPVDRESHPVIALTEFGSTVIRAGGREVKPRIAKSLALLAYLASVPGHRATREDLLAALFDGQTDESSRAYLRQAAHRLREALPEGQGPFFTGRMLEFAVPVVLDSESIQFEARLTEAARLSGSEKLSVLLQALDIVDRGEYLPGVESTWAVQRREYLEHQAAQARLEAAQIAFKDQSYQQAIQLAEEVVARDPFKESAWRLLMRIVSAVGDEDRVVASFHRCITALNELGITPSDSTRALFDRLRR